MRKIVSIFGTVSGLGVFLLRYANQISNYLGIFSLPSDLKDALIVLSNISTPLAWGMLVIGLSCLGYLVSDSGHHTAALAAIRKRTLRVEPSYLIILGIILAALGVGWQFYREPQRPLLTQTEKDGITKPFQDQIDLLNRQLADLQRAPTSVASGQPEIDDLKQKLAAVQQELTQRQAALNDANQQRDTAVQEANALRQKAVPPVLPVDPMAPPPPKIPYQDGPILQRTYVDDEPKTVINALRELTQLATAMQRDIVITQELTMRRRAGSGNQSPQNWAQALVKYGYDDVSKQLNEIGNKAKDYSDKMNAIIAKPEYDYFASDLYRIVGQTGLQELQSTAGGYVYSIQLLKKNNIPETMDKTDIIWQLLNEPVRSFEQASVNFRYWNNSFLNQRAPTAREQLEKIYREQHK